MCGQNAEYLKFRHVVELVQNLVAHGDAREGKWRGNCWMEWVASTLTPPPNMAYPALLKLMRTPRLLAVDWTDAPTDLNGLVSFGERRNLVSASVPSRSARAIHTDTTALKKLISNSLICNCFVVKTSLIGIWIENYDQIMVEWSINKLQSWSKNVYILSSSFSTRITSGV